MALSSVVLYLAINPDATISTYNKTPGPFDDMS